MQISVIAVPVQAEGTTPMVWVMECSECGPLGVQTTEAQVRAEVHLMKHGTLP